MEMNKLTAKERVAYEEWKTWNEDAPTAFLIVREAVGGVLFFGFIIAVAFLCA